MQGFQVPALTIRRAETTVELGSGESFMIAGLLNNRSIGAIDKIPGLGDIPVLGTLFKSDSFRRGETELVIVVTPYLVQPVSANDIKLPTDAYRDPNDLQRLLLATANPIWVTNQYNTSGQRQIGQPYEAVLFAATGGIKVQSLQFFNGVSVQTITI